MPNGLFVSCFQRSFIAVFIHEIGIIQLGGEILANTREVFLTQGELFFLFIIAETLFPGFFPEIVYSVDFYLFQIVHLLLSS